MIKETLCTGHSIEDIQGVLCQHYRPVYKAEAHATRMAAVANVMIRYRYQIASDVV